MKIVFLIVASLFIYSGVNGQKSRDVKNAKGLEIGVNAPLFDALDADSIKFNLAEALEEGPVILIFYRGFWCPVCNKHLGKLQDSLQFIETAGAKVIAVSPENPEYLDKMEEKTGAGFTLLYDEDYRIADAYDVTFKPTSIQLITYNVVLNGDLKKSHSDDSQLLPIPATYIISQDGIIAWRQFDPDYKNRASVKEILAAINAMKNNNLKDFCGYDYCLESKKNTSAKKL
jgi:peroxiredoxin